MPRAAGTSSRQRLQIRLLGELQLGETGSPLTLPASRKTRALLAYLAVNARRHVRGELCCLFWEDAADPRAGLRWSLTQLRRALGEGGADVIRADRDSVELRADLVATDLDRLTELTATATAGVAGASRDALLEAAGLFRGEFLEGLDLPGSYTYHEWCMAERESASNRREQVLLALIDNERERPELALVHARALAAHNPLNERGHVELIRTLAALDRPRDALAQYEQCCRIFERELGIGPPAALLQARAAIRPSAGQRRRPTCDDGTAAVIAPAVDGRPSPGFIGRSEELGQLQANFEKASAGLDSEILLLTGAPGIGKSRLLDAFAERVALEDGRVLRGRAFEAEMLRPFGFWVDALRGLRNGELPAAMCDTLLPLTHPRAAQPVAGDRDSLFDKVVDALAQLARSRPLVVLVDDLHWIEASSAALLHYAIRKLEAAPVLFVLTGRSGEIDDNTAAQQLVSALARARRLRRIALGPLSDADAHALLAGSTRPDDAPAIVTRGQGVPLILLELARLQAAGVESPGMLDRIVENRLAGISQAATTLLDWASAFGREFSLDTLIAAQRIDPGWASQQLAELERHELIIPSGDSAYAFSHDLVQQAAYRRISQPLRRLMHKAIAVAMDTELASCPETGSVVAHHASLGGQATMAARASVVAGEQALRMFANREAAELARRGRRDALQVTDKLERVRLQMGLLRIGVLATSGQPFVRLRPAAGAITEAIAQAHACRLHAEVAEGHYLLSVIHQEAGDIDAARSATLQAAQAADRSDRLGRARQLANSARCLVELRRDIPHARALLGEARKLAEDAGLQEIEVRWGCGLLHHWDGEAELAVEEMAFAVELATDQEDRWRQCKCLAALAMIELDRRRPDAALLHASALSEAAAQLGEAADAPLALAITALALRIAGSAAAPLNEAVEALRAADDQSRLAAVLNLAAQIELERDAPRTAAAFAGQALQAAEAIGDINESVIAHATLLRVDGSPDDAARRRAAVDALHQVFDSPQLFSASAVRAAEASRAQATAGAATVPGSA